MLRMRWLIALIALLASCGGMTLSGDDSSQTDASETGSMSDASRGRDVQIEPDAVDAGVFETAVMPDVRVAPDSSITSDVTPDIVCTGVMVACVALDGSSYCADPRSDPANCGGCGVLCGRAGVASSSCDNRVCTFVCDPRYADCNNDPSDGCEADLTLDPNNCTACGLVCASGTCQDGCH